VAFVDLGTDGDRGVLEKGFGRFDHPELRAGAEERRRTGRSSLR
jgi:hypothetical protein